MLPNQVLNAIPRQKVKHIESGEVFYVIAPNPREKQWIMVLTVDGYKDEVLAKMCEPVPEEPMALRIGDKVVTHAGTFSTIAAIRTESENMHSYRVQHSDYDFYGNQLRLATPQERKDYFLND